MSAQEETLRQYHQLMQLNAVAQLFRTVRQTGILDLLDQRQHTAQQLADALSLDRDLLQLVLDAVTAAGIVQRYGDDYAISPAAQLLCQHDADLGDRSWDRTRECLTGKGTPEPERLKAYFYAQAATQWTHTASAMQAAEMLDIGGDTMSGLRILDLGSGSAVWSCAMAFRDKSARVTAVDEPAALAASCNTVDSIGIGDRFEWIEADPQDVELPADTFDLALLPQRIGALTIEAGDQLIGKAAETLKPGGQLAVLDLFSIPSQDGSGPRLSEAITALRLHIDSGCGSVTTLEAIQQRLQSAGFSAVQFSFLAASHTNMGMAVGTK
ncbi:MAG: methyltransferase domain-containing protein [Planctomycetota bacterium]